MLSTLHAHSCLIPTMTIFRWELRGVKNLPRVIRSAVGSPGGSVVESACSAGAAEEGLLPGLGRSPGRGNGNPLQCSCLENPTDRGALWATAHGVSKELDTTEATIPYWTQHTVSRAWIWNWCTILNLEVNARLVKGKVIKIKKNWTRDLFQGQESQCLVTDKVCELEAKWGEEWF